MTDCQPLNHQILTLADYFCPMFTGIVEALGEVVEVIPEKSNLHFWLRSHLAPELKIDQSLSHDGICLTVVEIKADLYRVTAVGETIGRTNMAGWKKGTLVNLERCMPANGRFDGHIVQGHVDCTGLIEFVEDLQGSYKITVSHPQEMGMTVAKGSVTLNGVSLTVVDSTAFTFSVVIIPYTWTHTNLASAKPGSAVNIEFDIIGKYLAKMMQNRQ